MRVDRGQPKLMPALQESVRAVKQQSPKRSIRQILRLLEAAGLQANLSLSRSTVHRLLQQHGLTSRAYDTLSPACVEWINW